MNHQTVSINFAATISHFVPELVLEDRTAVHCCEAVTAESSVWDRLAEKRV